MEKSFGTARGRNHARHENHAGCGRLDSGRLWGLRGGASVRQESHEAPPAGVQIGVDPRVELLCIVFRLAGNPEYNRARIPAYVDDVERQFGPLRGHQVVALAKKLRQTRGISFDACMSLAVHLKDANTLEERIAGSEATEPRFALDPEEARIPWRAQEVRGREPLPGVRRGSSRTLPESRGPGKTAPGQGRSPGMVPRVLRRPTGQPFHPCVGSAEWPQLRTPCSAARWHGGALLHPGGLGEDCAGRADLRERRRGDGGSRVLPFLHQPDRRPPRGRVETRGRSTLRIRFRRDGATGLWRLEDDDVRVARAGLHLAIHPTPSRSHGGLVEEPGGTGTTIPLGGRPLEIPGRIRRSPRPLPDPRVLCPPHRGLLQRAGQVDGRARGRARGAEGDLGEPVRRRTGIEPGRRRSAYPSTGP